MRAQLNRAFRAESPLGLSWRTLGLATAGLAACDLGFRATGGSFVPGGPLDELAHLLTALLFVWALGRVPRVTVAAALVAAVAIDLDHVPDRLGVDWLTAGTPRPYTHSLLTIAVVLGAAALWRRRQALWLGVALGLSAHLFRDVTERGGASLLWPVSKQTIRLPQWSYVAAMIAVVGVNAWRCHRRPRLQELAQPRVPPGLTETA